MGPMGERCFLTAATVLPIDVSVPSQSSGLGGVLAVMGKAAGKAVGVLRWDAEKTTSHPRGAGPEQKRSALEGRDKKNSMVRLKVGN